MARQQPTSRRVVALVVVAVIAFGLLVQFEKLYGQGTMPCSLLGAAAWEGLDLAPCFVAAAWQAVRACTLDVGISSCAQHILAASLPLLQALAGVA
jgi:hypothetical protein